MRAELGSTQRDRYSRQLMIDLIEESDQCELLESGVLVVGVGGLGSPVIQYLAAAGVGRLGIVDDGALKRSNLQRQVIHAIGEFGDAKADIASRFVKLLNDDVTVDAYNSELTTENAVSLLEEYDIVVDCLDSFAARYLLNDAAIAVEIPMVHGAVYGFEGQSSVFLPGGPCYRCLYPQSPDSETIPSGKPMGIFPPIAGIIGCIQANEVLKYLLEIGDLMTTRILRFHGLDGGFTSTPLEADPACPSCGSGEVESLGAVGNSENERGKK